MHDKLLSSISIKSLTLYKAPFVFAVATVLLILFFLEKKIESLWLQDLKIENVYVGDSSYAAYRALTANKIGLKTVVMIGGSVTREASLLDAQMERLFYSTYNQPIQFLNLGSSDQTLAEGAAIVKTLELAPGSIVFIQLSFKRLDYSPEKYRAEYFRPNMAMLDYSIMNNVLNYSDVFMRSITPQIILNRNSFHNMEKEKHCNHKDLISMSSPCYTARKIIRHGYEESNRLDENAKKVYLDEIKNIVFPNYLKNGEFSATVLQELLLYIKQIGAIPVLIEYPVSDIEKPLNIKVRKDTDYIKQVSALSNDIAYLDWSFDSDFVEQDFYDTQHMLMSGKQKLSEKLLQNVKNNYFK